MYLFCRKLQARKQHHLNNESQLSSIHSRTFSALKLRRDDLTKDTGSFTRDLTQCWERQLSSFVSKPRSDHLDGPRTTTVTGLNNKLDAFCQWNREIYLKRQITRVRLAKLVVFIYLKKASLSRNVIREILDSPYAVLVPAFRFFIFCLPGQIIVCGCFVKKKFSK